jgi:hypothetical protein
LARNLFFAQAVFAQKFIIILFVNFPDFGFSCICINGCGYQIGQKGGSDFRYSKIEILKSYSQNSASYCQKADFLIVTLFCHRLA